MKQWGLLFLAVCLVPCVGAQGKAKDIDSNFTNKVFKIKMYPGAKMIPGSSQRVGIDKPWGWAKSFNRLDPGWGRGFTTPDDRAKVLEFFRKQLDKIGTNLNPQDKWSSTLAYRLKNGDGYSLRANKDEKGGTSFEIYFGPASKKK